MELGLKRSTRKPLGPELSADGLEEAGLTLTPPRAEAGPENVGTAEDVATLDAGDIAAVCVAGVELCLKTSTSMPLGPESSAAGPDAAVPMLTPPRAEAGPENVGTDEDVEALGGGGEEDEENEEHPARAGNRPIETTKRTRRPRPRRPRANLLTVTRAHAPCVPIPAL